MHGLPPLVLCIVLYRDISYRCRRLASRCAASFPFLSFVDNTSSKAPRIMPRESSKTCVYTNEHRYILTRVCLPKTRKSNKLAGVDEPQRTKGHRSSTSKSKGKQAMGCDGKGDGNMMRNPLNRTRRKERSQSPEPSLGQSVYIPPCPFLTGTQPAPAGRYFPCCFSFLFPPSFFPGSILPVSHLPRILPLL
jgi:hypothetical protein